MILVIGAEASGKLDYVRSLGYSDDDISFGCVGDRPVVYGLQDIVRADVGGASALLPGLCDKDVVACCEVGSGVIPAQREEREYREAVGRLTIALANRAERVVRLVCGISTVIKE